MFYGKRSNLAEWLQSCSWFIKLVGLSWLALGITHGCDVLCFTENAAILQNGCNLALGLSNWLAYLGLSWLALGITHSCDVLCFTENAAILQNNEFLHRLQHMTTKGNTNFLRATSQQNRTIENTNI